MIIIYLFYLLDNIYWILILKLRLIQKQCNHHRYFSQYRADSQPNFGTLFKGYFKIKFFSVP